MWQQKLIERVGKVEREVADVLGWLRQMEQQAVQLGHVESHSEFIQLAQLALVYLWNDAPTHVHIEGAPAPQLALVLCEPTPPPQAPAPDPAPQRRPTRHPVASSTLQALADGRLHQLAALAAAIGCTESALKKRAKAGQLVAHRQAEGGTLWQVLPLDAAGRWMTVGEVRHLSGLHGAELRQHLDGLDCKVIDSRWRVYRARELT